MKKRLVVITTIACTIATVSIGLFLLNVYIKQGSSFSDNGEALAIVPTEEPFFLPLQGTTEERNTFMEAYAAATDKYHLRALYEEYLSKIGTNGLVDSIESVTPTCHDEGHDLGKVFFANIQDVSASLAVCHDACSSGCMHGVLMEFFSTGTNSQSSDEHASLEMVTSQMEDFCKGKAISDQYLPGDCAHGIGHTLMFLADYNLLKAIEACDAFDTYAMRYYCATGAYMEYNTAHEEEDSLDKSTFYPCDSSPYPAACFRYKLVNVFRRHYKENGLFSELRNQCLALPNQNTQLGCFHGIGNAHMGFIARGQVNIDQVCNSGTDNQIFTCIDGAMERLGKYFPELVEPRCEVLADGWKKDLCLTAGKRKMYDLTKSFDLYQR